MSRPNALQICASLLDLPEGAVPESSVITLMYLDEDGKEKVEFGFVGDSDLLRMSGALNVLIHKLNNAALE